MLSVTYTHATTYYLNSDHWIEFKSVSSLFTIMDTTYRLHEIYTSYCWNLFHCELFDWISMVAVTKSRMHSFAIVPSHNCSNTNSTEVSVSKQWLCNKDQTLHIVNSINEIWFEPMYDKRSHHWHTSKSISTWLRVEVAISKTCQTYFKWRWKMKVTDHLRNLL